MFRSLHLFFLKYRLFLPQALNLNGHCLKMVQLIHCILLDALLKYTA